MSFFGFHNNNLKMKQICDQHKLSPKKKKTKQNKTKQNNTKQQRKKRQVIKLHLCNSSE